MRLDNQIIKFLKQAINEQIPDADIYLFGSRTNDDARGGDIDVMIITQIPVNKQILRSIRIAFYKKFGWRKIDIVNFIHSDQSVFKRLIQSNSIVL